jgi:hypothetical protein
MNRIPEKNAIDPEMLVLVKSARKKPPMAIIRANALERV